jgi:hypothetical protein
VFQIRLRSRIGHIHGLFERIMPSSPYTGARWLKMKFSELVQFRETLGTLASIACVL